MRPSSSIAKLRSYDMGDSDSSPKKVGVPSWQLKSNETTTTEENAKPSEAPSGEPSREVIVEQAKKFLEDSEVKNESTDKKIAFLEGKGLTGAEIQELIGVTRNIEASSIPSSTPTAMTPSTTFSAQSTHTQTPPRTLPPSTSQPPPQPYSKPQTTTPPIITYPEFLTTSPHPTPLVTKSRLLTTLYLFSGISALLYGTSTYLLTPMLAQLTESRLSLASSANKNLHTLIAKLEELVSEIPVTGKVVGDEEEESEDEDPTEMFHRDIGVQTSLPSTPRPSTPSLPSALDEQSTRLTSLTSNLQSLIEAGTSEGQDEAYLSTTVGVLREYLDGLAYVVPSYGYGAGGYTGGGREDDEISRVKSSIRGVKGVLLSARSFPGVGRAR